MALDAANRREALRRLLRDLDVPDSPLGLTKADVLAAVSAWDDFLDTNAAAINAALPQPARGALSVQQKVALFHFVLLLRYGG